MRREVSQRWVTSTEGPIMGDICASKASREEILDHIVDTCMQNSDDEKLSHDEKSNFQSSCKATQEKRGMIDTHGAHGKKLKAKPDKALPCPRCESLDTKFCYFNNYNVNQPRHYCRKCQRYWTAGGLLRDVPMGAGRRRTMPRNHVGVLDTEAIKGNGMLSNRSSSKSNSKTASLHLQKPFFPLDVEPLARVDGLSTSSAMLSFGQHTPPCEVMAVRRQQDTIKRSINEQYASPAYANFALDGQLHRHKGDDTHASSNSCLEASSIPEKGLATAAQRSQINDSAVAFSSGIHNIEINANAEEEVRVDKSCSRTTLGCCFDAAKDCAMATAALHCTNTASHEIDRAKESATVAASNCIMASDCTSQCTDTANSANVSLSTQSWPVWNGFPGGMWVRPLTSLKCTSTPCQYYDPAKETTASETTSPGSADTSVCTPNWAMWNGFPGGMCAYPPWPCAPTALWGSPTLDWASSCWRMPWLLAAATPCSSTRRRGQAGSEVEGCLWVPKTLRIDDPVEAARSSIWTTLGLDEGLGSLASKEGIAKSFQYKADTQNQEESTTQTQHSNPAALSRSITFNETT